MIILLIRARLRLAVKMLGALIRRLLGLAVGDLPDRQSKFGEWGNVSSKSGIATPKAADETSTRQRRASSIFNDNTIFSDLPFLLCTRTTTDYLPAPNGRCRNVKVRHTARRHLVFPAFPLAQCAIAMFANPNKANSIIHASEPHGIADVGWPHISTSDFGSSALELHCVSRLLLISPLLVDTLHHHFSSNHRFRLRTHMPLRTSPQIRTLAIIRISTRPRRTSRPRTSSSHSSILHGLNISSLGIWIRALVLERFHEVEEQHGQNGAGEGPDPVDPVVPHKAAVDDGGTEGTGGVEGAAGPEDA